MRAKVTYAQALHLLMRPSIRHIEQSNGLCIAIEQRCQSVRDLFDIGAIQTA
jgi:hypothetical protein